ncbi:helicase domain-containing family protein [Dorcoceras hygrometricum]|uniref:Helicase domain-containing family protein n=1 Tax=Dorcoceras hygrometricum TaxID=472368 RepID=A0A2Z7BBZ5_9LAMI|nr:helicase domain-containing family protein [Dorcoceras hygrometricum]
MVVDLIVIYGLKGPYCTLTTTNWFLQALSVIPRGSWGDVARRSYHDPLGKSGIVIPGPQWFSHVGRPPPLITSRRRPPPLRRRQPPPSAASFRDRTCSVQFDEEFPSVLNSSVLLVQADEGVLIPVVDLIDDLPPPTV